MIRASDVSVTWCCRCGCCHCYGACCRFLGLLIPVYCISPGSHLKMHVLAGGAGHVQEAVAAGRSLAIVSTVAAVRLSNTRNHTRNHTRESLKRYQCENSCFRRLGEVASPRALLSFRTAQAGRISQARSVMLLDVCGGQRGTGRTFGVPRAVGLMLKLPEFHVFQILLSEPR